jgi:NAD-dependent deacetylase
MNEPIDKLAEYLRRANQILIFTGAGVSTGSGIPDFRSPQGLWQRRKPVYYEDFMRSEAARIEHWDFKMEMWKTLRDARPNAVHRAVAKLEQLGKIHTVVTQNIDGLHEKGGTSPGKLVELHGTSSWIECQTCHELYDPEPHFAHFARTKKAPLCSCGGYLKTATISFGQNLNPEDMLQAQEAARETDLVVALGSSLSVYPAADIPLMAAEHGAPYIIINRGPTDHDHRPFVVLRLEGDVVDLFPPAVDALQ